ncbi:hypothetical protein [Qipengyuania algicida]|nr:hypothetical protein [Qipengyuania algicida]
MKNMTYAEVIGISAEGQIPTSDTGSLTEFLGSLPNGKVVERGMDDTFMLADETTYFADKEINFGDVFIVLREMQKETARRNLDLEQFTADVMNIAMTFRKHDSADDIEFRDFCAEQSHELDIALEKQLGVYEPDRRPGGRDYIRDFINYDDETRDQFKYGAAMKLAESTRYFPCRPLKYLDLCAVLEAMKAEAVVKGLNARRFAYDIFHAAVLIRSRAEPDPQAFRAFCADEKRKLREHLDAYLIARSED